MTTPINRFIRIFAAVSAVGLFSSAFLIADDTTGKELLKPTPKTATTKPEHQITYKLSDGSNKWDANARERIIKAMDEAVAIYNKNGDFNRVLTANWNPGTPTADANFGGWINFGGQIGMRTALHEIAHCLGIGTSPKWGKFSVNGKWIGEYGIEQLKELDGPDAVLHCDRQHFWPYGLNYDNEGGPENFVRNVLMVTAMRADMGLGPPPHPGANALRAAKIDAAGAHADLDKAQSDLKVLQTKLKSNLGSRPEVIDAAKETAATKSAYETATAAALKQLRETAEYKNAEKSANDARQNLETLQADPSAKTETTAAAATAALDAKSALTRLETNALSFSQAVKDANSAYQTATAKLTAALEAPLKNDPQLLAAKQAVETARGEAATADQAVKTAELAAAKEQSTPKAANSKSP